LPQQILWNKFHIRCAYFTPNCTWSLNYSVLVCPILTNFLLFDAEFHLIFTSFLICLFFLILTNFCLDKANLRNITSSLKKNSIFSTYSFCVLNVRFITRATPHPRTRKNGRKKVFGFF
jgi:hypothetical protein